MNHRRRWTWTSILLMAFAAGASAQEGGPDLQAVEAVPDVGDAVSLPDVGVSGRAVMKDGSVIVGEVLGLEGGTLRIATPASADGEVGLAWGEVTSLETGTAVLFWLTDDVERNGRFLPGAEAGKILVQPADGGAPESFDAAALLSINPTPQDQIFYKGGIHLGATKAEGNTDTASLTGRLEAGIEAGRHELGVRYLMNYAEDSSAVTERSQRGVIDYDLFLTRRLFLSAGVSGEEDLFQDLRLRTIYSIGPGWAFVRKGDLRNPWLTGLGMQLEAGVAYFDEDRRVAEDRDFLAGRWAFDLDWGIHEGVRLFHNHEGLVSLEDAEEILVRTEQGLELSLAGGLAATFSVNWDWNNTPSPGFGRTDTKYITTLGYKFSI